MSQLPAPPPARSLPPEVVARLEVALQARPAGELPPGAGEGLYELLVRHGYGRAEVLALAASLVEQVTSDVAQHPCRRV